MERKGNRLPIFTKRFRELQDKRSNTDFADFLGLSRQTVGFYCNGDRLPDVITLIQIAERCNVSTDYLLGVTDIKSTDVDIQKACGITGLSEDAIYILQDSFNTVDALNVVLCERPFRDLLLCLYSYRESVIAESIYNRIRNGTATADASTVAFNSILENSNLPEDFVDSFKTHLAFCNANDIKISTFDSTFCPADIYELYASRSLKTLMDTLSGDARIFAEILVADAGINLPPSQLSQIINGDGTSETRNF